MKNKKVKTKKMCSQVSHHISRTLWATLCVLVFSFYFLPSVSAQDSVLTVELPEGQRLELVWVEGGEFTMGSDRPEGVERKYDAYRPAHKVEVSGFWMCRYELTQGVWKAVMGENPSNFTGNDSLPVEQVSWVDAQRFVVLLSQQTGKVFRLPTEAEWEYAARGGVKGKGTPFAGGNRGNLERCAWFCVNSGNRTHPVGRLEPNELGLYDMGGNVAEWCVDWMGEYKKGEGSVESNPRGPADGDSRILRGGHWGSISAGCAVFDRGWYVPTGKTEYYGLRVAMEPEEVED